MNCVLILMTLGFDKVHDINNVGRWCQHIH